MEHLTAMDESQQIADTWNNAWSMLEDELMRAQRLSSVGALASSITHEFNNILTTVINYAKDGVAPQLTRRLRTKSFDRILSAGQRAAQITTGMLAYARQTHPTALNRPI
jgi:C4-dicarboxylate-specific signal transduction histidine kinase